MTPRLAARFAIVAQPLFAAYWLIAGANEPGYSPMRQAISELGAPRASAPWLLDTVLVLWGLSIIAAGWALRRADPKHGAAAGVLIIVAGIAIALAGPVHVECWSTIHPNCAGAHSTLHEAHGALAWATQAALAFSAVALAWGFRDNPLLFVLAGCAALVLLFGGGWVGPEGAHNHHAGLGQRVGIASAQLWVALIAIRASSRAGASRS